VIVTILHQKTLRHKDRPSLECKIPVTEDYCPVPTASAPSVFPAMVLQQQDNNILVFTKQHGRPGQLNKITCKRLKVEGMHSRFTEKSCLTAATWDHT